MDWATLGDAAGILAITAVAGGLGGSVHPLIHESAAPASPSGDAEDRPAGQRPSPPAGWRAYASSSWMGAVGAIGFLFIEVSLGSIDTAMDGTKLLRLAALGVIAGFGARRLLPMLSNRLEHRVEETERLLRQQIESSRAASARIETLIAENDAMRTEIREWERFKDNAEIESQFRNVIDGFVDISEYPGLMERARRAIDDGRSNWAVPVWYAMQLKRDGQLKDAVAVLTTLVERIGTAGDDLSRVKFNLACYHSLLAATGEVEANGTLAETYLREALASEADRTLLLRQAAEDPDLEWVRTQTAFGARLKKAP